MKRVKGNLIQLALDGDFQTIIHGCNCQCTMNSGVAKEIREVFPEAYEADCRTTKGDRKKLGSFSFAEVVRDGKRITIVNAYTQYGYGRTGVHVDYAAVQSCMVEISASFSGTRIAYPRIGAGLGGGDWHRIALLIEKALEGQDHTLVLFDKGPASQRKSLYAGIGSRKTPEAVLKQMWHIARRLAARGFVLRTGGADGADTAFWEGRKAERGQAELWLPWAGFNGHQGSFFTPRKEHFDRASRLHPAWERLDQGPRALHARNVGQVLGASLDVPVNFVIAWTPDSAETAGDCSRETGGTGTAIRLASELGIPVYNLKNQDAMDRLAFHVLNLE